MPWYDKVFLKSICLSGIWILIDCVKTLSYPQQITLFQTGDDEESASFDNFLDAIDASYCTYDGGDVAGEDGTYPDKKPGGYKYQDCGNYTAPSVISTSYGYDESDLTIAYAERQCYEYMKLGLAGTTFLYSSGDDGKHSSPCYE